MQRQKAKLSALIFPLLFIALFTMYAVPAEAGGYFAQNPDEQPSIFTYGLRGIGVGALDGMAAGYLVIYSEISDVEEWRIFLASTGIGAMGGAALGLATGFIDMAMYSRYPSGHYVGMGAIILRDALYGALFGGLLGTIGGGVAAILNEEGKSVPLGAAIGTLSGTALGILIGVIEGRVLTRRHDSHRQARLQFGVTPVMTAERRWVPLAGIAGTF
ncbi:MAG: hypothetical protein JXR76_32210 [Deltaproteobacteria bacterium]|nr:hypothetical protein [Deltaproteobacteria bacterium]